MELEIVKMNNNNNNKKETLNDVLKEVGAIFIRKNKHEIWRLPNNKIIAISSTSSDINFEKVNIRLIRKLMKEV